MVVIGVIVVVVLLSNVLLVFIVVVVLVMLVVVVRVVVGVAVAVCPGLVFIEKLQNDDLMMTSFVALRRPNDDHLNDHLNVSRMTSFTFCVVFS